ncbi:MAG: DnaJ domain-containing protein [Myxococcota bacterium]
MGDAPNTRIPRLKDGVAITSLPIDPFEGFMLSRIDGRLSVQEIADSTGATIEQVDALVAKLEAADAVSWIEGPEPVEPPPEASEQPRRSTFPDSAGRVHTRPPPPGTSLVLYDPAELEEAGVELDVERRREILDRFYRLDELDHYALLGVSRIAEKKVIRDAYFALSKQFHPDTLFGKELGSYKHKMEAVFGALTEAYETLSRKKRRKAYDEYIGLTDATRAAEAKLEEGRKSAELIETASIQGAESAVVSPTPATPPTTPSAASSAAAAAPEPAPEVDPRPSRPGVVPPPPDDASGVSPSPRKSDEERRRLKRELYRRRLAARTDRRISTQGKRPSGTQPRTPEASPSRQDLLRGLAGSLRSVARLTGGVDRSVAQVRAARKAEAEGDLVAATNALRLAVSLNDDPKVRAEYERVRSALAVSLADSYEKQAKYEESNEKWGAAALSWNKVADGRPNSVEPLWRGARAILRAGGDLKHARELAQEATKRMPDSASARATLAAIYLEAGMKESAKREAESAAKLDPGHEMVKTLLDRLG